MRHNYSVRVLHTGTLYEPVAIPRIDHKKCISTVQGFISPFFSARMPALLRLSPVTRRDRFRNIRTLFEVLHRRGGSMLPY